jgi:hypothetical protein
MRTIVAGGRQSVPAGAIRRPIKFVSKTDNSVSNECGFEFSS